MTRLSTLAQLRRISHRGTRRGSPWQGRRPRTDGRTAGTRLEWAALAAASLPGIAALAALLFTWVSVEQSGRQLRIAERGQVTDRFNAAIGNLSSPAVDVRLGGVYGLERLMRDSPDDQPTVVTLLTAYVRGHADGEAGGAPDARPATDVQAAMTVLANRDPARDGSDDFDLRSVRLRHLGYMGMWDREHQRVIGINFPDADFSGADLSGADLTGAKNLKTAEFRDAVLVGTRGAPR